MPGGPRISLVTPSFNQAGLLRETIESVLSQGCPELDYVVIDGASTDGSAEIIAEYSDRLSYWVSEPDGGLYAALNKGFAHTDGEIMGWINSSDLHYPWTLRIVAEIFSQLPEVEWVMGMPTQFTAGGAPRSVQSRYFNVYDVLAGGYRWIQQESVFWRRSLWDRAGAGLDESLRLAADFDLWLRFLRLAPLHHVQTVLGGWRVHDAHLGEAGGGAYLREVQGVMARYAAQAERRSRVRAGLVRTASLGGRTQGVGKALHRSGLWPWYAHPRVIFDFKTGVWKVR
jgi:glycosyltransferase involved in cell wall biosynthesis